jgi:hypothetical protein
VSIETSYGLDELGSVPGRGNDGIFSPRHRVQTSPGAHPASYPVSIGGTYPVGKAAGA